MRRDALHAPTPRSALPRPSSGMFPKDKCVSQSEFFAVVVIKCVNRKQGVGEDFVADGYVALCAAGVAACRVMGGVFGAVDEPRQFEESVSAAENIVGCDNVEQPYSFLGYYAVRPDHIDIFRDSATVYVRKPQYGGKGHAVRAVSHHISAAYFPERGNHIGSSSFLPIGRLHVFVAAACGQ